MQIYQVPVRFSPGTSRVSLREISGYDEQTVAGTGTAEAVRLVARLLVNGSDGNNSADRAMALATADRDMVMAAIYSHAYGDVVKSTVECAHCEALFDIDFSIAELSRHLGEDTGPSGAKCEPNGVFRLPDGRRFRLPSGEDEVAILGMPAEEAESELLRRCVIEGDPKRNDVQLQTLMKKVAPLLDINIEAVCPECGESQMVHFDIQYFLLSRLKLDQERLTYEVHRLSAFYGWGLNEILELPSRLRRTYVGLAEMEIDSGRRRYD